ncbi:hypothetical protein EVAR_16011_1 [Eumeta japonica]|uniref:Uncharacterized protein n=1 Tax=Eumeta variegata TaxID=151549 RepID=A0A4C1W024_EUMVA|nr:hypothetical protein EVAR_16011_1 [Eumeta japonica]
MKQFVKKLDETSEAFGYLRKFFPKLSEAKVKTGVFVGPQIKQIFADEKFSTLLNRSQKASWNSFKAVVSWFLGYNKAEYYKKLVEDMRKNFKAMGCRVSLKVHTLHDCESSPFGSPRRPSEDWSVFKSFVNEEVTISKTKVLSDLQVIGSIINNNLLSLPFAPKGGPVSTGIETCIGIEIDTGTARGGETGIDIEKKTVIETKEKNRPI